MNRIYIFRSRIEISWKTTCSNNIRNFEHVTTSSVNHRSNTNRKSLISKFYHLKRVNNYAIWMYCMKHMMQREGLFEYCTIPPSTIILESTRTKRESALVAINNNAKNTILKLLKRYDKSYQCWA